MIPSHWREPRPVCPCCERWMVRLDSYRNVCRWCGTIEGDETRALTRLCQVFAVDNPWMATSFVRDVTDAA